MSDRALTAPAPLEDELQLLSAWVVLPATPPIAGSVAQNLAVATVRRSRLLGHRWLSIVLAVIALLALAAAAVAVAWVMGGVRLTFTDATPSVIPSVAGARAFPGRAMPLDQARGLAGFRIAVPTLAALETPDRVMVDVERPTGGSVALLYGARPGYPAAPVGIGLAVTVFRADISPEIF